MRNRAMGRGAELTAEPEWRATHTVAREEERSRWRESVTDLTCARHSKHANQVGIRDTGEPRGTGHRVEPKRSWRGNDKDRADAKSINRAPGPETGVENRQKKTPSLCRISNVPPATWVGNMRNTG